VFVTRELTTNQKGVIAEAGIEYSAAKLGIAVYKPTSGHSRADMIFEIGAEIWRVQVKWGQLAPAGDVVIARVRTNYLSPAGYVRSSYTEDEIDLLAVYCGELDRAFLLPIAKVARTSTLHLRLSPPHNNQRACINLADEYDFAGAVAQLGERRHGMAEARGSSPLSSTEKSPALGPAVCVGANAFRDKLGYWMDQVSAGQEVVVTRHGRPRLRMLPAG
jgi:hypothetical protein